MKAAERFKPALRIPGYPETFTRTPHRPLARPPLTLSERTGPLHLERKLALGTSDLSRPNPDAPRAMGQLIWVTGRLLDEDGDPVCGAMIEVWHANAAGRYRHRMDANSPAPLDPNFAGSGRCVTDRKGRYAFLTVKPGAYAVPNSGHWWRPPHIHYSVFGDGFLSRLVTQMFFPGEPLNGLDRILNAVPDPRGRERMIGRIIPLRRLPRADVIGYEHDIVVRGTGATPMGR